MVKKVHLLISINDVVWVDAILPESKVKKIVKLYLDMNKNIKIKYEMKGKNV